MIPSMISNISDKSIQGEVLGFGMSAQTAGDIVSPLVSGFLYDVSKEKFSDNPRLLSSLPNFVGSALLLLMLPLLFLPSLQRDQTSQGRKYVEMTETINSIATPDSPKPSII